VQKNRVALVIGNADYKYGGRLANPVNDASDFANVLRTLGLEVIEGRNLDKRGMDEKITEFSRKLDNASVGLFFYAGHGVQVDGDNWLIPVDARIEGGDLPPHRAAAFKTNTVNISQHGCPLKCTACGSRCLVRHVIGDRPCRLPKRSREKELKAAAAREVIERLGSNASPTWEWSRQSPRG